MARKIRVKLTAAERREIAAEKEANRVARRAERWAEAAEFSKLRRERLAALKAAGEVLTMSHGPNGITFAVAR